MAFINFIDARFGRPLSRARYVEQYQFPWSQEIYRFRRWPFVSAGRRHHSTNK